MQSETLTRSEILQRFVLFMQLQNGVDLVGIYFHFTKDLLMKNHILPLPKVCSIPSKYCIVYHNFQTCLKSSLVDVDKLNPKDMVDKVDGIKTRIQSLPTYLVFQGGREVAAYVRTQQFHDCVAYINSL